MIYIYIIYTYTYYIYMYHIYIYTCFTVLLLFPLRSYSNPAAGYQWKSIQSRVGCQRDLARGHQRAAQGLEKRQARSRHGSHDVPWVYPPGLAIKDQLEWRCNVYIIFFFRYVTLSPHGPSFSG